MPYLSILTNKSLSPSAERAFLAQATERIEALLGKSRAYIMVSIKSGQAMVFGGDSDPAAFVRLKSIGLDDSQCPELAAALSQMLDAELDIPPDRVFIDFQNLDRARFAWNGKTFS